MVKRAHILFGLASLTALASLSVLSAGCKTAAEAPGATPTLTAAQQAEKEAVAKKANISLRENQINRSNLPPEQKQALLNQIRSSAGK